MVRRPLAAATFALLLPLGCTASGSGSSSTDEPPPPDGGGTTIPNKPTSPDGSAGTPVDSGVDAPVQAVPDASSPPDGGGTVDAGPPDAPVALPFHVSDDFIPSGYMGDSQGSMAAITMSHDASKCKSPRQPGAAGDCYTIAWAPTPPDGGSSWAGVYWQSPAGNWGAKPGKAIAPGATKVSFWAAGAAGGETIQACAGGINPSPSASAPYGDTFSVKSQPITLTTTWTRYELSLQGSSYSAVLGGFCWVAAASAPETWTFYVDDLVWE